MNYKILSHASSAHTFWLSDGKSLRSVYELKEALKGMSDEIFSHHVNDTKNDFASWIKDIFNDYELSERLKLLDRQRMAEMLEYALHEAEEAKKKHDAERAEEKKRLVNRLKERISSSAEQEQQTTAAENAAENIEEDVELTKDGNEATETETVVGYNIYSKQENNSDININPVKSKEKQTNPEINQEKHEGYIPNSPENNTGMSHLDLPKENNSVKHLIMGIAAGTVLIIIAALLYTIFSK